MARKSFPSKSALASGIERLNILNMQSALTPLFAAGVVDQIRDAFHIVDADELQYGMGAVAGSKLDRAHIEHPFHEALRIGNVIDIDYFNPVRIPRQDSRLMNESLRCQVVMDAHLPVR